VFYIVLRDDVEADGIASIIGDVIVVPEEPVGGRRGYSILYRECYEGGDYSGICAIDRFAQDLVDGRIDGDLARLLSRLDPDIALATPMAPSPQLFFPAYLDKVLPYAMYWKAGVYSDLLTSLSTLIDECTILHLDTTPFPLLIQEVLLEEERQALNEVQSFYTECRNKLREVMIIELRENSTLVKFRDRKLYLDYLKAVKSTFQESSQEALAEEPT